MGELVVDALLALREPLQRTCRHKPSALYRFWPVLGRVRPPFAGLVPAALHERLAGAPLYLSSSSAGAGLFKKIDEGLFRTTHLRMRVEAYAQAQFALFSIPPAVARSLKAHRAALRELTPAMMRAQLRKSPRHADDIAAVGA